MEKFIKHTVSIVMSIMIVAAVGGISVIHHYCGCNEQQSASLFIEENCCGHANEMAASCCSSDAKSASCCNAEADNHEGHQCDGDCCYSNNTYLRLTDSFTVPEKTDIQEIQLEITGIPVQIMMAQEMIDDPSEGSILERDHAPPPSIIKIFTYLNRFKLSPPPLA